MKTRTWKKLGIILGVLALVLIIIGIVTPMFLDLNRYHGFIVSEVEKAVGGKVKLGRISWGLTHRLWLEVDGFSIIDASAFPGDVKLTRIYASVSIPRLLTKKVALKNLRLESSEVKFRLQPAAKDTGPPAGGIKSDGVHLPVEIEIQQLAVAIKRLELDDALSLPGHTRVHVFSDVDLAATNIAPAKEMTFNLALRDKTPSGLGALKAQGTFSGLTKTLSLENPDLKLKAVLKTLHVAAIKPYLKNSQLKDQLDGSISLDINYEGDLGKNLRAQGVIDLSGIAYTNPSLWDAAIPGRKTTLTYQVKLNPDILTAEKLALKLGNLSLVARAEVHSRGNNSVIKNVEFSSDLPLVDLIPLVPWKQLGDHAAVIRSALEGGGKIVIDQAVLPEIDFAKPPTSVQALLPGLDITAHVSGISVQPSPMMPRIKGITGRLKLEKSVVKATDMQATIGPLSLPAINIHVANIAEHPKVALRAKGPLKLAATADEQVEKLLLNYGLKTLTLAAEIDVSADFDQRRPEDWTANGSFELKGLHAQSHPAAVAVDDLKGQVKFSREKTMNITAQDISARINQAPVRLSGQILGIGSPQMLVSVRAYTRKLDLSHLAELLPTLKTMKFGGMLDMDLDVHVPFSAPAKSRLKGTVTTRNVGFQLASSNLTVAKGNLDITLAGNSANIKSMTMQVNDQKVTLSGQISNPVEPKVKMLVTTPDLNLDRLLPPDKAAKPSSTPSDQSTKKPATDRKAGKAELPPVARKLTADLKVQAGRGQYRGLHFEKLKLDLLYKQGVIESYDLKFGIDKGHIAAKGSADLRDLDRIRFTVDPNISALPLETVTSALGIDNLPPNGPLTLKGQLRGITGSTKEILGGLNGKLDASLGPGNLNKVGKAGDFIAKLSSMAHISSLFSGRLFKDFSDRGIPFETITAQTSFGKGTLNLNKLHFGSDAMTVDGQGKIDLINRNLNVEALLVPLATVDKTLHYVPIVGKALEDVTKIQIDVEGPLEDPKIHTAEAREIGKGIETEVDKPKRILQDVGKGLKETF
jgi:uncharacterized protein involved in outer membrane biogenesis